MDLVTQQNAANAEESASASEELSAQANQMKVSVDELTAMVGGGVKGFQNGQRLTDGEKGGKKRLSLPKPLKRAQPRELAAHDGERAVEHHLETIYSRTTRQAG
jgi:hypothetical protein